MSRVFAEAQLLLAAGVSVIPLGPDGTKRPVVSWKAFQSRRPTEEELQRWFASAPCGLVIVEGYVSGGLEVLDCDAAETFEPSYAMMVKELATELAGTPGLTQTPSDGRHVPYRRAIVEGNQKLAWGLNAEGRPETLIKTRGADGYAIIPPSPLTYHRIIPSISRMCRFAAISPRFP
jgi:hypothetical protein